MNDTKKTVLKAVLALLFLDLIFFFIYMSFSMICVTFTSRPEGYVAYSTDEDGQKHQLYKYYYTDGEDTKMSEYEEQGIEVETVTFRSTIGKSTAASLRVLSNVFTGIILAVMIYSMMWSLGIKDRNLDAFGHITLDKYRGLKIGLLASVPSFILYILLIVNRFSPFIKGYMSIYKLVNAYMFAVVDGLFKNATTLSEVPVWAVFSAAVIMLPLPVFSVIGYYCGINDISLKSRLIYKKEDTNEQK